jgi:hypothetical protein
MLLEKAARPNGAWIQAAMSRIDHDDWLSLEVR